MNFYSTETTMLTGSEQALGNKGSNEDAFQSKEDFVWEVKYLGDREQMWKMQAVREQL